MVYWIETAIVPNRGLHSLPKTENHVYRNYRVRDTCSHSSVGKAPNCNRSDTGSNSLASDNSNAQ